MTLEDPQHFIAAHRVTARHDLGRGFVWRCSCGEQGRCSCGEQGRCGERQPVQALGREHVPPGEAVTFHREQSYPSAAATAYSEYRRWGKG